MSKMFFNYLFSFVCISAYAPSPDEFSNGAHTPTSHQVSGLQSLGSSPSTVMPISHQVSGLQSLESSFSTLMHPDNDTIPAKVRNVFDDQTIDIAQLAQKFDEFTNEEVPCLVRDLAADHDFATDGIVECVQPVVGTRVRGFFNQGSSTHVHEPVVVQASSNLFNMLVVDNLPAAGQESTLHQTPIDRLILRASTPDTPVKQARERESNIPLPNPIALFDDTGSSVPTLNTPIDRLISRASTPDTPVKQARERDELNISPAHPIALFDAVSKNLMSSFMSNLAE